jgi:hypothetical protein
VRSPHWIAAIAISLAVGAAFGWFAGASSIPETPRFVAANTPDLNLDPAPEHAAPLAVVKPPDPRPQPEPAVAEPEAAPKLSWQDVVIPALTRGEGEVVVRTQDPLGNPVQGIEVALRMQLGTEAGRAPVRADFDDEDTYIDARIRHEYRRLKLEQQATLTGSSDAEGRIKFTELPGTTCTVSSSPAGYLVDGRVQSMSQQVKVGDELVIMLVRACTITIDVSGLPESAAGRCSVRWKGAPGLDGGTSYNGRSIDVRVLPGEYGFTAYLTNPAMESPTVELTAADTPLSIELTLAPATKREITVNIRYEGGEPLQSYTVIYAPARTELRPEEHLDKRRRLTRNMRGDKAFRVYRSGDVEPGDYVVGVMDGDTVLACAQVSVGEDGVAHEFELHAPGGADGVTCFVQLPQGAAPAQPQFRLFANANSEIGGRRVWLLRENTYLVTAGNAPRPGGLSIEATVSGLGTRSCEISSLVGTTAEFVFNAASRLTLRIRNLPQALRDEITIGLRGPSGRNGTVERGTPVYQDGDMFVVLGSVQPGTYEFWVLPRRGSTPEIARAATSVEDGKDCVHELVVYDLYEITLEPSGITVADRMSLHWAGQGEKGGVGLRLGRDGKCIVPFLPAGTYTVKYSVNQREAREKAFTVSSNATVYLTD